MTRLMQRVMVAGCAVVAALAALPAQAQTARPSFITIVLDDASHQHRPFMQNSLREIAGRGLDLQQNYITRPICTPGRFELWTGMYARGNRTHS